MDAMPNPATASSAAPAGGLRTLTATSTAAGGSRPRTLRRISCIATLPPKRPKLTKSKAIEPSDSRIEDREADAQADEHLQVGAREWTQRGAGRGGGADGGAVRGGAARRRPAEPPGRVTPRGWC